MIDTVLIWRVYGISPTWNFVSVVTFSSTDVYWYKCTRILIWVIFAQNIYNSCSFSKHFSVLINLHIDFYLCIFYEIIPSPWLSKFCTLKLPLITYLMKVHVYISSLGKVPILRLYLSVDLKFSLFTHQLLVQLISNSCMHTCSFLWKWILLKDKS